MEREVANTALLPMRSANAAWPILYGNPLHRPVRKRAKTSALNKCHQDAQADFSLLLLSGSAFDKQGDELPEISCCHLAFSTAGHRRNEPRFSNINANFISEGRQQHYWRFGQSMENKKSPRVFYSIIFLSWAKRLFGWSLVKHIQPFHVYWSKHLLLTFYRLFSMLCSRGSLPWYRNQKGPTAAAAALKHHLCLPGPSWARAPLLAPEILCASAGKVLEVKSLAKQMRRKQQSC